LLEVVMALGLSGLVGLAVFGFYTSFTSEIGQLSDDIEISTDIESGQRILMRDLKLIDTSFGVINVKDDSGESFFDYFPDVPENDLAGPITRTLTLKMGGRTELVLLLHDSQAHSIPTLNYDPSWAYRITNASFSGEGAVEYQHVNWVQPGPSGHASMISSLRNAEYEGGKMIRPGFWNDGQLLMFDSVSMFRSPAQTNQRNRYPPRPPFFVGRVNGTQPTAPFNIDAEVRKHVNTKHPISETYENDSANAFLWGLPSTAGGMPLVRLRPVKLVKFYIKPMYPSDPDPKRRMLMQLYRHVYTKGKWDLAKNHFMIAEKLKSVQFRRNSVSDKAVLFDISRSELSEGETK